jgi:hypothetical protein
MLYAYKQGNTNTDICALNNVRTHAPVFERAKRVHALAHDASVIGIKAACLQLITNKHNSLHKSKAIPVAGHGGL